MVTTLVGKRLKAQILYLSSSAADVGAYTENTFKH